VPSQKANPSQSIIIIIIIIIITLFLPCRRQRERVVWMGMCWATTPVGNGISRRAVILFNQGNGIIQEGQWYMRKGNGI
jgi:hypothetical protein